MTFTQLSKQIIEYIEELAFPSRCIGCDEILLPKEVPGGICQKCMPWLQTVGDIHCVVCGKKLKESERFSCKSCQKTKHKFIQNKGVFTYEGIMKESMYRFKYGGRQSYGKIYAKHAATQYKEWIEYHGIEAIVPVPMYGKKQRRRGYNQAEIFARELGKFLDVPVYEKILVRVRDTKPQKNMNQLERKYNMKNAFKIRRTGVKLSHILIVDDIYTTGTTLDGAAEMLYQVGVDEIYCLCICVGRGD